jgi:hypothetical protein
MVCRRVHALQLFVGGLMVCRRVHALQLFVGWLMACRRAHALQLFIGGLMVCRRANGIDRTLVHIDTQNLLSYAYRCILMIKYTSYDMVNMMGSLVDIIC